MDLGRWLQVRVRLGPENLGPAHLLPRVPSLRGLNGLRIDANGPRPDPTHVSLTGTHCPTRAVGGAAAYQDRPADCLGLFRSLHGSCLTDTRFQNEIHPPT